MGETAHTSGSVAFTLARVLRDAAINVFGLLPL